MEFITSPLYGAALFICALVASGCFYAGFKYRGKWLPELDTLVTLDARGWRIISIIATVGAFVTIGTSQLFGTVYWVTVAAEADGLLDIPINARTTFWFVSISTVAYFFLSIIFEVVSDIGAPMASGLAQAKKKGTPTFLMICVIGAIAMSLVSKWGIYEDKVNARGAAAADQMASKSGAQLTFDAASLKLAAIDGLPITVKTPEGFTATKKTVEDRIVGVRERIEAAESARDKLPDNHSTNRLKYEDNIRTYNAELQAIEQELSNLISARALYETRAVVVEEQSAAKTQITTAEKKTSVDGTAKSRVSDNIAVRLIRVLLQQALCFVFPIIAFDADAMARQKRKLSEGGKKGAAKRAAARAAGVRDAEFEEATPVFGGYIAPTKDEDEDAAIDGDHVEDDFEAPQDDFNETVESEPEEEEGRDDAES